MKLLKKNQSATYEGLTDDDLKFLRKELAVAKARLKNLPPGLERMAIQSRISE
jgi:5-bromo-4-chloroindolyl phosphate hydrolysis protein